MWSRCIVAIFNEVSLSPRKLFVRAIRFRRLADAVDLDELVICRLTAVAAEVVSAVSSSIEFFELSIGADDVIEEAGSATESVSAASSSTAFSDVVAASG